jgi:hypothetical protein
VGKFIKLPFNHSRHRSSRPFDLVHVDLEGKVKGLDSEDDDAYTDYYVMVFVDDYTRYSWIYFLDSKSDVYNALIRYLDDVSNHTLTVGRFVIQFRVDGAKELNSARWHDILRMYGVGPNQVNPPHTPPHNGVAERFIGVLFNTVRALLISANLGSSFSRFAISHAAYLRRRIASDVTRGKTPYELLRGRAPDLSHLRIFGSDAVILEQGVYKYKLDPRGSKGILVGYGDDGHTIGVEPNGRTRFTNANDDHTIESRSSTGALRRFRHRASA